MDVAGTVVGVASLGIQICQGILSYYDAWKGYPEDIQSTYATVRNLRKSFALIKESLTSKALNVDRANRVKESLESCKEGLEKLKKKLRKLREHDQPSGFRQKAFAAAQRSWYPFRSGTLGKLKDIVHDLRQNVDLACDALHLDLSLASNLALLDIKCQTTDLIKVAKAVEDNTLDIKKSVETTSSDIAHFQGDVSIIARRAIGIEIDTAAVKAELESATSDIKTILTKQEEEELEKVLGWLDAPDSRSDHELARRKCTSGTGDWFLQSEAYLDWKKGQPTLL